MSDDGDEPEDADPKAIRSRGPIADTRDDDLGVPRTEGSAVTAWARIEGAQRGKRKRITLDMVGPPLSLPNAPPTDLARAVEEAKRVDSSTSIEAPSVELALPDLDQVLLRRVGAPQIAVTDDDPPSALDDGWGRSREMPSNAPPRPRASTPPPFNAALTPGPASPGESDVLRLVTTRSRPPGSSVLDLEGEMIDRYALGDFTGALLAAELVLGKQAEHPEAMRCASSCRERLCHLHLSRLGGAARVPSVAVDGSEIRWLGLDHRAGFLLSRVDGASTVDELVDLAGMARHEALKILVELLDAGALKF